MQLRRFFLIFFFGLSVMLMANTPVSVAQCVLDCYNSHASVTLKTIGTALGFPDGTIIQFEGDGPVRIQRCGPVGGPFTLEMQVLDILGAFTAPPQLAGAPARIKEQFPASGGISAIPDTNPPCSPGNPGYPSSFDVSAEIHLLFGNYLCLKSLNSQNMSSCLPAPDAAPSGQSYFGAGTKLYIAGVSSAPVAEIVATNHQLHNKTTECVPTLTQWGLIIFGFLLLSYVSLFTYRKRRMVTPTA